WGGGGAGGGALRGPAITGGIGQWGAIQTAAPSFGVEVSPINMHDVGDIEDAVAAFARASNGGLILTGSALAGVHRNLIITLAARHKFPPVYFERFFVAPGRLLSYWADFGGQVRAGAGLCDPLLKGRKPT